MSSLDPLQESLLTGNALDLAFLWRVVRRDGVPFFFTSFDKPIEFEGNVYSPVSAGDASATRRESGLKDANRTYTGFISSDLITHDDLAAGRFDEAVMTEYVVNWKYPWMGAVSKTIGWLVRPVYDDYTWQVEIEGVTRFLRDPRGGTYQTTCIYDRVGNIPCGKDISDMTVYDAEILTVSTDPDTGLVNREAFAAKSTGEGGASLSAIDDFYVHGRIIWASGANKGLISECKSYTASGFTITLKELLPFAPAFDDQFVFEPGCNKTWDHCKNKFANPIRFRGFRFIPGVDKMLQPAQKKGP